jgi:hypothetical protein
VVTHQEVQNRVNPLLPSCICIAVSIDFFVSNLIQYHFEHPTASLNIIMPPTSVYESGTDYRSELVMRLRGQTIQIRDILRIYHDWVIEPHSALDASRNDLEKLFQIYIPTESERVKARKINSALCTATFWTKIPAERFMKLARWMAWIFFWDDEIDCGLLRYDTAKSNAYIDDSIAFVRYHLLPELNNPPPVPGRLHNCGPWIDLSEAMLVGQSFQDRKRIWKYMVDYFESMRSAQVQRLIGVEALDAYIERRAVNIASHLCLALMPWAYGLTLPSWIWEHDSMERVRREVAIGVFIWNDIISLQKELKLNDVDSIIPIIVYHQDVSAQEAVDTAVEMIAQSYQDLIAAKNRLKHAARNEDNAVQRDIETLLNGCTDVLVGNMIWSLSSQRYLARGAVHDEAKAYKIVL